MNTKSVILTFLLVFVVLGLSAQCPMCRMAAESNLDHGGSAGKGLNTGILYMLLLPYLMVAGLGYLWYKNRKTDIDYLESDLQAQSQSGTQTSAG